MALAGEVVELIGANAPDEAAQRGGVVEIGVLEKKALAVQGGIAAQMLDARAVEHARAADDAVDGVAFLQQQLRKVGAVLAGDAGDEGDGGGGGHGGGGKDNETIRQ